MNLKQRKEQNQSTRIKEEKIFETHQIKEVLCLNLHEDQLILSRLRRNKLLVQGYQWTDRKELLGINIRRLTHSYRTLR